jgi:hypothetical protein
MFQIIPLLSFPAVMNLVGLKNGIRFSVRAKFSPECLLCWVKLYIINGLIYRLKVGPSRSITLFLRVAVVC